MRADPYNIRTRGYQANPSLTRPQPEVSGPPPNLASTNQFPHGQTPLHQPWSHTKVPPLPWLTNASVRTSSRPKPKDRKPKAPVYRPPIFRGLERSPNSSAEDAKWRTIQWPLQPRGQDESVSMTSNRFNVLNFSPDSEWTELKTNAVCLIFWGLLPWYVSDHPQSVLFLFWMSPKISISLLKSYDKRGYFFMSEVGIGLASVATHLPFGLLAVLHILVSWCAFTDGF